MVNGPQVVQPYIAVVLRPDHEPSQIGLLGVLYIEACKELVVSSFV